jgi:short-subunit dehydrogenase involved in D-alanine esterification of teichoic acids
MNAQPSNLAQNTVEPSVAPIARMRFNSSRTTVYVFITGRRETELAKAKTELRKNVTTVRGDVANLADLDRLYEIIKTEKGSLDVVVAK